MDFKHIYSSSKAYISLLVIATVLLLFTAIMAYIQIKRMQNSADMVSHTFQVNNVINMLSAHYTKSESEKFINEMLEEGTEHSAYKKYIVEGRQIIDSLKVLMADNSEQLKRIEPIGKLIDSLNHHLSELQVNAIHERLSLELQKAKITSTLYQIRIHKNEMLEVERILMMDRQAKYNSTKFLAPFSSLLLGIFSLFVFAISFIRIYRNIQTTQESEAFLKNVLTTINNVINYYEPIFDNNGRIIDFKIIFANECNRDYFGLEPNHIIGERVSNVMKFLHSNDEFDTLVESYEKSERKEFYRNVLIKGEKKWFQYIISPLEGGIMATFRNSTIEEEAKQFQLEMNNKLLIQNKELEEVRSFISEILANSDNIISFFTPVFDSENRIVDFIMVLSNDNITGILGRDMDKIANKLMSEILPIHFENGVFKMLVDTYVNNTEVRFEKQYNFNNKEFWFKTTAVKLENGVLTTSVDTTLEKEAELNLIALNEKLESNNKLLLENKAFLTNIFKSISHVVMHFTSIRNNEGQIVDFNIEFINERLNLVTNDNPEKVKNKKVSEIFPTVFNSGVFENLVDAIENDTVVEYEVPYEGNGENQWFSATAIKLNDGVTVTTRNITEERQKTEELRSNNHELIRSNEELQAFNRVASHDLQEPLRKIQLFISRISDDKNEILSEKLRLYFDKIESAAERMQTLIKNLLTYSSMEVKYQNLESVNLNEILEKVKTDLVNTIDETGAILNFGDLPNINGVSHQFEQLFSNLISNAIKYRSENRIPQITIRSEKISRNQIPEIFYKSENFYHKITVTDNGIGFHAQYSEKIFEVFQRLHHKSEYSGTGIGLSICKKVVENHRGHIFATSEPDKGSVFVLYLPA